jgi:SAM-dependent methyltransferase
VDLYLNGNGKVMMEVKGKPIPPVPGSAHYGHLYESKGRLASYWHQVDECSALGGKSVLSVGKGSGLPLYLLERRGFRVTTLDIQPELQPIVLGDVRHLPFSKGAFDVAMCCQVLEHLPFEFFAPSVFELKRVVRLGIVLSLPDRGNYSKVIPRLMGKRVVMELPNFMPRPVEENGEHCWEINTKGVCLREVQEEINKAGLTTDRTFRVWEFPYHRFWRLKV